MEGISSTFVVFPAYNEKDSIAKVLNEIQLVVPEAEIIVVDDFSTDGTPDIVKRLNDIKLICHTENRGPIEAVISGVKSAKHEVVVTINADGQHPIELIPKITQAVLRDEVDIVMGVRPTFLRGAGSGAPRRQ